ncbi:hypothetical protein Tco_1287392, partial [Tanacetum coccineum]
MDSRGAYHITYMRDYLVDFEVYDSGNILLSDGRECRARGTSKVQVQMRDGSSFVLDNVRYVSELSRNLISLGSLKKRGFYREDAVGKDQEYKGFTSVTMNTLKGRKQLGEYHTGWKIKTGNVLDSCNQRNMGFNESGEYKKTFINSGVGTGSMQVLQGVEFEEVQTQDLIYYHPARDREQHSAWELFSYREDSNEAAFAIVAVEKIYAHESLTFNNIVACEVIYKWKAGLKDDMDARSDVYVLSNGCKKCSDDSDGYYWEYTPAKGNVLGMKIVIDQSGNTLRVSQSRFYNGKLVQTLLEGHSILTLEGTLSGDCDVEKNGKWSYIYAVGSQEYQMVCTRLDIASADVEAAKEVIWLKGLAIESGFELKIVAGIATGALSKVIPGS